MTALTASLIAFTLFSAASSAPASAADSYCSDGSYTPPVQLTDNCFVRRSDYNRAYIAEVTAATDCSQIKQTFIRLRIRVVGDYEALGDKFHVRMFSIRYLSGTKPWAFFQINVTDGNGLAVNRSWNSYGGWVKYDGAGQYTENTMNLVPPASYSPVFGRNQAITFDVLTRESDGPAFPYAGYCTAEHVYVRMVPSSLP